ncbi:DNA helicase Pif1-like protein [Artemisia annua]|uniref:DNA helicase Pif1-like protein n=1 Tax=Artemisia annua TaxID=35608 RepID=A0A2U1M3F2_ARTAN|nr:DNA helicase Pif1-like protein [Artemisia annua]
MVAVVVKMMMSILNGGRDEKSGTLEECCKGGGVREKVETPLDFPPIIIPPTVYKGLYDSTCNKDTWINGPFNQSVFPITGNQKALPYSNNGTIGTTGLRVSVPMVHGEGSSHAQEPESIRNPYDKWPYTFENGHPNHKQGQWTNGQKKMVTAHTSQKKRKEKSTTANPTLYDKGSVGQKHKKPVTNGQNVQYKMPYSASGTTTDSCNMEGTGTSSQMEIRTCAKESRKKSRNQTRADTQNNYLHNSKSVSTSTGANTDTRQGVSDLYNDLGDCDCVCEYCGALFWYGERLRSHSQRGKVRYGKCCVGGQLCLENEIDPPPMEPFGGIENSNLKREIVERLIQSLDQHNELVQVFRTARDKCNEGSLPEFKIQLYNVTAAKQYQLPSAGTLGAIVLEPDANTETDFDMIIEYKDKQPKRINKLHSSYMSLQFPLLFVYGQPGYNTDLRFRDVNGKRKRSKVSMNVYYKYQIHQRLNQYDEDDPDDTSWVTIPQEYLIPNDDNSIQTLMDFIYDEYTLKNPTAQIMEAYIRDLRPRDRDKVIEAKIYRSWMARDPPDVTEKGYRAILLDKQGDAIQANTDINDKSHFTNILIPGRTYRISGFGCVPTDNWPQTLENTTSLSFTKLTKFDTIASTGFPNHYFDFVAYNQLPSKVVDPNDTTRKEYPVLTDYIGCYMRSGEKEKWGNPNKNQMINRKIEIQNLKYRALFNINPPLQIVRHPYQDREQEKMRNRIPLTGVRFTCEGVITSINTLREWYYPACTKCINKVEVHEDAFDCKIHGPLELPDYKFNFKTYITDGTATAMLTFFTPKADEFVGVKCNALVQSLKNPDPKEIPEELQAIVGRKHIFQFHFNTSAKHRPPDFIFNQILDEPTVPPQIEATPSGSHPIEQAPNLTEGGSTSETATNLHTRITSPTEGPQQLESSQGMTAKADILQSPDNIIMQKDTGTGTATPPTPHMGMQTRSKTEDAARKTIKRPLFPEETAETKKRDLRYR